MFYAYLKKYIRIILFIIFITPSFAETLNKTGSYLGTSLGYAYISNNTNRIATNNIAVALAVLTGYKFNQYFAADTGISLIPNEFYIQSNVEHKQFSTNIITDVAARVSIPYSDFVFPYFHIGPSAVFGNKYLHAYDNLGVFVGLGAEFKLSQAWGVNVEDYGVLLPHAISYDINVIALGVTYAF